MISDYNSVKVTTFLLNNLPFVSKLHKKDSNLSLWCQILPPVAAIHQSTHIAETLPTVEEMLPGNIIQAAVFPQQCHWENKLVLLVFLGEKS